MQFDTRRSQKDQRGTVASCTRTLVPTDRPKLAALNRRQGQVTSLRMALDIDSPIRLYSPYVSNRKGDTYLTYLRKE